MAIDVRSEQTASTDRAAREAPLTLTTEPPRTLGFLDQLAMWANLGISLFGPITGALVATTTGSRLGLASGTDAHHLPAFPALRRICSPA